VLAPAADGTFPEPIPVVPLFIVPDLPVVILLPAAGLPDVELPAAPLPVCAIANVAESVRAVASTIVVNFMIVSSLFDGLNNSPQLTMFRLFGSPK
jgi:hypothetical protein